MISDEALGEAVARGLISADQAQALRALAQDGGQSAAMPFPDAGAAVVDREIDRQDDEALRFVTSFADIFVSLGLVLFFGSAAYLIAYYVGATGMWAGLIVLAWLVAEFFSRRRRLALPSIFLLLLFSTSVFAATSRFVAALDPAAPLNWWHPTDLYGWLLANAQSLGLAGLATAAMTGLYYLRFRVPITIAGIAAALIATAVGLAYWLVPDMNVDALNRLLLIAGILVFLAAMRFDMSDLERKTRRTDIAFWLHLLAAPLIVRPLITAVEHGGAVLDTQAALAVLAIYLGLGVTSLIIDRRALLVSGLTYAGVAFGTLLKKGGLANNTPAATLLALGLFILVLSALWHPLRRAVLKLMPGALVARLPNTHGSAS